MDRCSVRGPCDSDVTQKQNFCERRFLCDPYRGYVMWSSCDYYKRVLRRHPQEYELVVRESPVSKDMNTDDEEATALEVVTSQRPVNKLRRLSMSCSEL
jgi:hypothetical protein